MNVFFVGGDVSFCAVDIVADATLFVWSVVVADAFGESNSSEELDELDELDEFVWTEVLSVDISSSW